ncbi:gluconate:H+ symporter [Pontixanthobacter sp. CEM42]|uniref:GntP family permease n=1 Tax=Pontixanthobacter sp. CEM42 TaxID=2792077 RepID=UPI001ADF8F4D|nr:gluconate:H+ symporter [Pontixanthobacter sp. CEM42]
MQPLLDIAPESRALWATVAGVAALLFFILHRKFPAFPALLLSALLTGLAAGLSPEAVIGSIQSGMGGVLGFIAIIVGLGALLGAFLEAGGGAQALARSIISERSPGVARYGLGFAGILIAIPVFFDVGLILLIALVRAIAKRAAKPAIAFGLPLLAGLAAGHAFIPPTPGPVAVADILGAPLGLVILCGLAAGIPAMLVAGPIYSGFAERRGWLAFGTIPDTDDEETAQFTPGLAAKALSVIAFPIVLIVAAALVGSNEEGAGFAAQSIAFLGHPFVALLMACGLAALLLKPDQAADQSKLRDAIERAFEPTAAIILVTGAGGAFKQVLIDTGAGDALAQSAVGIGLTPLVAGFALAAIVRVAQGSATVAMLTAAGLVAPLASAAGMDAYGLALLTISIAAGASVLSHVNDSGFWLVSRYFGLSMAETMRSWTVASTLVGVVGFALILLMALLG